MSEKKRQHFVPKFYMRQFSSDTSVPLKERKRIHILNLRLGKLLRNVGLKEQCYRDYFYGKDLARENQFARQEGFAQLVFSKIIANRRLPAYGSGPAQV